MTFNLKTITMSGKEILPIIEGGKGIGVSSGSSSGAFANAGAVGTFSGVTADYYDENGKYIAVNYKSKTRQGRFVELVDYSIKGGIAQAKIANDIGTKNGLLHINVLWEMGGAIPILEGILKGTKGLIDGVTCGAGMPYKVAEIASQYRIYYYPIISSMRAFRALWKRSYSKYAKYLGGVVYEDPWLAGGHNGLSNAEDPLSPQDPYQRVVAIRKYMNEIGLNNIPVIMAGGVWHLKDWQDWIDDPDIAPIAFQFGTRPILTKESPVPNEWKKRLMTLKKGDILLNKFSPTGFYSSAVNNAFINELTQRNARQVNYQMIQNSEYTEPIAIGTRGRQVFVKSEDKTKINMWNNQGFSTAMRTPDSTLIFVTQTKSEQIIQDQQGCMGCLSACRFSNWRDRVDENYTTGRKTDPRSFCIQKTLQDIVHIGDVENQLMFAGHNAYKFAGDPFYKNDYVPTVKELVERIKIGL